ncbi:hypothetical protein, partial [Chelativorans intermedius]
HQRPRGRDRQEDPRRARGKGRPPQAGEGRRKDKGKDAAPRKGPRPERPTRVDPDSPFAKLAALKEQLTK